MEEILYWMIGILILITLFVISLYMGSESCNQDSVDKDTCKSAGYGQPNDYIDPDDCKKVTRNDCVTLGFGQPNNFIQPTKINLGPKAKVVDVMPWFKAQDYPTKTTYLSESTFGVQDPSPGEIKSLVWTDDTGIHVMREAYNYMFSKLPTEAYYGMFW